MKQEKRIILRWNTRFKTILLIFILGVFYIGISIGILIGNAITPKACEDNNAIDQPPPESTVESAPEIPEETPTKIYYDCPLSENLQDYIRKQCEENDLPMPLILAMIEVESSFKADVISPTDDYGLMQINKINHERMREEYGIKDFLDPYQNVFCGITILSEHYTRFGDIDKALMAYNMGAFGAKRIWNIGIYQNAYTERIRASMEAYTEV